MLDKIPIEIRRKVGWSAALLAGLSHIYFLKGTVITNLMDYTVVGKIDVATIIGAITIFAIAQFYYKKM